MTSSDPFSPSGLDGALGGVSSQLKDVSRLADGVGRTLANAFRSAATDGKSLSAILGDIARSFEQIALRAALRPLGNLISTTIEGLFTPANPAFGAVKPFARGGVIAAPSYFPLASGLGVAGEAGPEAIMPLARGSDGRLGVATTGGAVNVTFNVTAADAKSFTASEAEISAMLLRAVRRGARAS